ncbi:GDSL-type esterase/lipase family protein [Alphaproteobacteria bacterium]|nr:GDSL-type esterase/lipase family protein [Alphaproteobacteria bacterium]
MHIFVFGDSNSWGYLSNRKGNKYEKRWPLVMLENLQKNHDSVILSEDSLPGRTTAMDDIQDGYFLNGARTLKSSLLANSPIDHSIIMLGTNDLKTRFNKSAKEISHSLIDLAKIIYSSNAGKGGWHDKNSPSVSIICPPILGELAANSDWNEDTERSNKEWIGGYRKSILLCQEINLLCLKNKIHFIDSNNFIKSSKKDPIHWDEEAHHLLGKEIANILSREIF